MAKLSRRHLLKASGTGGLAGILASGRAPAYAQTTTVHWLKWNDFVPAADDYLRKTTVPEAEKALGIKIILETINQNDLAARSTAAIQSKAGPDIIMAVNNYPHIYKGGTADVSALCEEIGRAQGGFYDNIKANCNDGQRWLAVPYAIVGTLIAYRKSWFDEIGVKTFPTTWDELRAAGKKLKAAGRPLGQCLGHTVGDGPSFCYPYLWSFGGKEVEADGKTVALNSKATIDSVKYMTGFWTDALEEEGLAWDDSSNNRAFLAGTISATQNGASIYIEALRKPDQYRTEDDKPMKDDILHAPLPRGPAGQFLMPPTQAMMLMGYSPNQKAATDFLRWFLTQNNYEPWFNVCQGFVCGPTKLWEASKMWDKDPVMTPYRLAASGGGRVPGYAGLPTQGAAEVLNKYIIVDMYAKAVQGMPAEQAVAWAEGELKKIYGT
jgi:multiple sugar transport system substrate-binding protein